jgi:hypothetical protein
VEHRAVAGLIDQSTDKAADDRSADAEPGRHPETHDVCSWHHRSGEQAYDKPDENRPEDVQHGPIMHEQKQYDCLQLHSTWELTSATVTGCAGDLRTALARPPVRFT